LIISEFCGWNFP